MKFETSLFRCFEGKHTPREGGINRVPPSSDPLASCGPNHYANPAPEARLLCSFLCTGNTGPGRAVRVNCRPSRKTLLLILSTPDILKRNFFVVFRGKTHSARGGNRTGYRPVPTHAQAAGPTTMLIPPWNPAFSAASYAQEIQALGEQCASMSSVQKNTTF